MKSKDGKERWRKFMMAYEKKVDDYNFGTLVRLDPKTEYGEKESIFGMLESFLEVVLSWDSIVPRMQFYALEIAR